MGNKRKHGRGFLSIPIDRVAARGFVAKGEDYKFKCELTAGQKEYEYPPSCCAWPYLKKHDLSGLKSGRLTVLGWSGERSKKDRGSLWICKCNCGRYVKRRSKSIKNNSESMCSKCDIILTLRRSEHFRKYGYDKDKQTKERTL